MIVFDGSNMTSQATANPGPKAGHGPMPNDDDDSFKTTHLTHTMVAHMMTPGVVQIPGDVSVSEAAMLLEREQAPCLLVRSRSQSADGARDTGPGDSFVASPPASDRHVPSAAHSKTRLSAGHLGMASMVETGTTTSAMAKTGWVKTTTS